MTDVARLMAIADERDMPVISEGDTVKVHVKVVEGSRERVQVFEGIVIATHRPKSPEGTFKVRRIGSHGIGVERTFMFRSPRVDRVEVARRGRVRRAKLFYLRALTGKAARIKELRPLGQRGG